VLFGWSVAQVSVQSFAQSVTEGQQSHQGAALPQFPEVKPEKTDSRGKTPFDYVNPLIGTIEGGKGSEICITRLAS